MLSILGVWIEAKWDVRRWELALRTDKPVEVYQEMLADKRADENAPKISELSQQEQDWLRNSG
jgi:hypothetical protein